jgi:hypothetical protein
MLALSDVQHLFVLFVLAMGTQCCQFLGIVHSWLPLRVSLTFIYNPANCYSSDCLKSGIWAAMYISVRGIDFVSADTIFRLDFWTFPTCGIICFSFYFFWYPITRTYCFMFYLMVTFLYWYTSVKNGSSMQSLPLVSGWLIRMLRISSNSFAFWLASNFCKPLCVDQWSRITPISP